MADEVIIYQLPGGKFFSQDLSRVGTIGSENGEISFVSVDGSIGEGPFRIGKTHIQYVVNGNEVVGAITTIPLEATDGSNDKGNQ